MGNRFLKRKQWGYLWLSHPVYLTRWVDLDFWLYTKSLVRGHGFDSPHSYTIKQGMSQIITSSIAQRVNGCHTLIGNVHWLSEFILGWKELLLSLRSHLSNKSSLWRATNMNFTHLRFVNVNTFNFLMQMQISHKAPVMFLRSIKWFFHLKCWVLLCNTSFTYGGIELV